MRTLPALALGAAAYVVFLVATLPASLVVERVAAAKPGRIVVENASGTVWSGSATVIVQAIAGPVRVEPVTWSFLPAKLFTGRAAFRVKARESDLAGEAEVSRSLGAWQVAKLHAEGDAAALGRYLLVVGAWLPSGTLVVDVPELAIEGERLRGGGTAEWRGAGLTLSEVRPLGTYRATLSADGAEPRIDLATVDGALRITGTGRILAPGRIALTGEARADPAQEKALEPVLKLFGARRADGAYAFEVR